MFLKEELPGKDSLMCLAANHCDPYDLSFWAMGDHLDQVLSLSAMGDHLGQDMDITDVLLGKGHLSKFP